MLIKSFRSESRGCQGNGGAQMKQRGKGSKENIEGTGERGNCKGRYYRQNIRSIRTTQYPRTSSLFS